MIGLKASLKVLAVALILVASAVCMAGADVITIDTTGGLQPGAAWINNRIMSFGNDPDNTATYGAVSTAPGTSLNSFTLYMGLDPQLGTQFNFSAYVYGWK